MTTTSLGCHLCSSQLEAERCRIATDLGCRLGSSQCRQESAAALGATQAGLEQRLPLAGRVSAIRAVPRPFCRLSCHLSCHPSYHLSYLLSQVSLSHPSFHLSCCHRWSQTSSCHHPWACLRAVTQAMGPQSSESQHQTRSRSPATTECTSFK